MSILCPYCEYEMKPKSARPGRFSPRCPHCTSAFSLVVPDPVDGPWTVSKLAPAVESTMATKAPGIPIPPDIEATGMMTSPIARPPQQLQKRPPTPDAVESTAIEVGGLPPSLPDARPARTDSEGTAVFAPSPKTIGGKDDTIGGVLPEGAESTREPAMPKKLGGYEILRELGRGGMGAVYLARQISLDRNVALKVMNSQLADDPIFLGRFIREAYAAAQLVHHNVVQIYDFGEDAAVHFFSMEFVDGKSLNELLKTTGRVDARSAILYIVQAARGLQFAHDRGMIHRDIKPDNLMLDNRGVVKVADLGLVKTPSMKPTDDSLPDRTRPNSNATIGPKTGLSSLPADMTDAFVAMGTPAYMSPEQCRDAANVDRRADIYSLGCTLYAMLTGRTPFSGRTAFEIMTKHATEEAPPPESLVADLPKALSPVLKKMMAREASDRQQDMSEVIDDLEKCLDDGRGSKGPFKPSEEHLQELEAAVVEFDAVPAARLRKKLFLGFFGLGSLLSIASLFAVGTLFAIGAVAVLVQTAILYFAIEGATAGSPLFRKVRRWAFGARIGDWLMAIVGGLIFVGLLYSTDLLWEWLALAISSAAAAFALHRSIDRKLAEQRRPILERTEATLKRFRLNGMDEDAIREFVARFGGDSWEEFYEALFGYESKLAMRPQVGKGTKFAAWREPLIARIDAAQNARREARERKLLRGIETAKLEAEGVDRNEARQRADAAAGAMVEQAAAIKIAELDGARIAAERRAEQLVKRLEQADRTIAANAATAKVERAIPPKLDYRRAVAQATKPPEFLSKPKKNPALAAVKVVFGGRVRFLLGALLVFATIVWAKQNLHLPIAVGTADQAGRAAKGLAAEIFSSSSEWKPLDPSPLPVPGFLAGYFDRFNPLIAGLILIFSLMYPGTKALILSLAGAGIAFFGHRFGVVPAVGPLQPHAITAVAGIALFALAAIVSRRR